MNRNERRIQETLVWRMALLMRKRDYGMLDSTELGICEQSLNVASKVLYDFHERMVKADGCAEAKPKRKVRATKQANPSTEPTHVLPSDQ